MGSMKRARLCRRAVDAGCRGEGGFTLIELMVVMVVIGILMAIAAPSFHGTSIESADLQAQGIAKSAAADLEQFFSQNLTYQNIIPSQLGCTTPSTGSCAGGPGNSGTWSAFGISWAYSYGGGTTIGVSTPDVAAVVSWNGIANWVGSNDTSTTVAVSAGNPANDCWFVTMHSTGPRVYGYAPGSCTDLMVCWPEQQSPYNASGDGFWYNGCGSAINVTSPLPTNGFPADPQI